MTQGESNIKAGKRSFTGLDTAEPRLILYKDNARREQQQGGKNGVLPDLILPSRGLSYTKMMQTSGKRARS